MIAGAEIPVVFTNEGMQLVGMLHRPDTDVPPPAVVFFHGCTGDRFEKHWFFVKIARALARAGIMALRFDFRHSGESEGAFVDMTFSGEVSDGIRAIDVITGKYGADPERTGILGLSMGGAVGAVVAGRLNGRIDSCVLINPMGYPAGDIQAVADAKRLNVTRFPIELNTFLFGEAFAHNIMQIKPLDEVVHATCPFLIVNGTGDTSIDPIRSHEYVHTIKNAGGRAELSVIEGADHVFSTAAWENDVIDRVTRWFSNTL
jgi:hypothetical protein